MGMIPCNFNKLIHVKSDDVQHNVYVCMGIFSFAIWPMCNHSLSLSVGRGSLPSHRDAL